MAQDDSGGMTDDKLKLVEPIRFLLKSVKRINDRFVEAEARLNQQLETLSKEQVELQRRLEWLERMLEERANAAAAETVDNRRNAGKPTSNSMVDLQLPMEKGTEAFPVPVLNLDVGTIMEVYTNNPILLEPFCRTTSLTARTLSGEIEAVELEAFAQGSTWVVESNTDGWLLLPRPGSLQRKTSIEYLQWLYEIEGVKQLPVLLHLIRPAELDAVEVGRRWQLRQKGKISIHPDPLRVGLSERMAELEQRLMMLEGE